MNWLKLIFLLIFYAILGSILVAMGGNAIRSIRLGDTDYIHTDFLVMAVCLLIGAVFAFETKKIIKELLNRHK